MTHIYSLNQIDWILSLPDEIEYMKVLASFFCLSILLVLVYIPHRDYEALWDLERKYWDYAQEKNLDMYMSLYADGYVTWSGFMDKPEYKEVTAKEFGDFLMDVKPETFDYNISPLSAHFENGYALLYYNVDWKYQSINNEKYDFTERYLHIWKRIRGNWKLIGGMNSQVPDK